MKIFSKRPTRWTMKADRVSRILMNLLISGVASVVFSLALPAGDLATLMFAVIFMLNMIGLDIRDRLIEIYEQNRAMMGLKDSP